MGNPVRVTMLAVAAAVTLGTLACSAEHHAVAPTKQMVERVGLPVYPHAVVRHAEQSTEGALVAHAQTLQLMLSTNDGFDRVAAFYQARVPPTSRKTTLPLVAGGQNINYVFFTGSDEKEVSIISMRGSTHILLQSISFTGSASPSP